MSKQKIEIEVDVPNGYRLVGWRSPKRGELAIHFNGRYIFTADKDYDEPRWVVVEVEPKKESRWRNVYPLTDQFEAACLYTSLEAAVGLQMGRADLRVERIDYENGIPVSVALEELNQ